MMKPSSKRALSLALVVGLVAGGSAFAQRRIIGAEERAEEEEAAPDPEAETDPKKKAEAEKKKKELEEKKKKEEEAAKKKADEEAAKAAAKAAAEEAARKAAEEAEQKKKEEEARKKKEAEEREQKRLEANKGERLKAAKKRRALTREDGKYVASIALEPGKPEQHKLVELRFELIERLEAADPKFGNAKPLADLDLVATVEEPAKGKAVAYQYRVQPLRAPGSYGMHHTARLDGEHTITVEGRSKKGDVQLSFSFPLHVGAWPPPGFDEEEAKNAAENAGRAAGSRRILGSK